MKKRKEKTSYYIDRSGKIIKNIIYRPLHEENDKAFLNRVLLDYYDYYRRVTQMTTSIKIIKVVEYCYLIDKLLSHIPLSGPETNMFETSQKNYQAIFHIARLGPRHFRKREMKKYERVFKSGITEIVNLATFQPSKIPQIRKVELVKSDDSVEITIYKDLIEQYFSIETLINHNFSCRLSIKENCHKK